MRLLGDINGDSLMDLIGVRNGEFCLWQSLLETDLLP